MKRRLLYLFLFLPFLIPQILFYIVPAFDIIVDYWRVVACICTCVLYLKQHGIARTMLLLVLLLNIVALIATLLNHGNVMRAISWLINAVSIGMLVEIMLNDNVIICFNTILLPLQILIYANFITLFLYPNGMYASLGISIFGNTQMWLLEYDNTFICYIFPSVVTSIVKSYIQYQRFRPSWGNMILIFVSFATMIMRWTVTGLVGLTAVFLYVLFPKSKERQRASTYTYIIICALVFLFIVVLRVQNLFEWFIVGVLRKSLTLTTRTAIWDTSWWLITQKPLIGYGLLDAATDPLYQRFLVTNPNSLPLFFLYKGGIMMWLVYAIILIVLANKLSTSPKCIISNFLSWSIFCLLLMWQFDELNFSPLLFIVVFYGYHIDEIIDEAKNWGNGITLTALENGLRGRIK